VSPSAAVFSSGVSPVNAPPTVVPPQVLALDLGAYDMELDPDAMGDSVAATVPACVCESSPPAGGGAGGGGDVPPFLQAAELGASRTVVHDCC